MMAEGGRAWRVVNPDFRPCVGDSDHRYLLLLGTIYSWDMQRYQTCKIVNIYHFPPLPQLEKNKACCMMVNKSISEKFEI